MTVVSPEVVQAARLVLDQMGIDPADLQHATTSPGLSVPTFAEYVPVVAAAVAPGSQRVYGTYWRKVVEQWGGRRLNEVSPTEIETLMRRVQADAVRRRNYRGGHGAAEHTISALRCLYRRAIADGYIVEMENPASKVAKPHRLASTRIALADERLAELFEAAGMSGNDPELDLLILRFHIETACRRGGLLALRPMDLEPQQCLVLLREKGGVFRWQPVTPTLMQYLLHHAADRGAPDDQPLLRYRNGRAVGRRRYDSLWIRLGRQMPWVAKQQVSAHWLRHTALTWVERVFGYGVALAYAGHMDTPNDAGTTARYVKATLEEVATALAALTGESHPLALPYAAEATGD
ncbi:tyrosine-type recombinase/integrase [Actinoplanes aureus]|uniref:Site-specific integrase n=1 Tax=Actinoplanes aureus TaxID=2792083 RepID=A0A931G2R6_9ACTN|nr:site-specific integrase [Actinoplanes aureus]MBG0568455.1 site-specific integrase [Actinoplanes aureus]